MMEEGPWNGGSLVLSAALDRFDWSLQASEQTTGEEPPLSIGAFDPLSDELNRLIAGWFASCSNCSRLAFAGSLLLPVTSVLGGYKVLSELLKTVRIDAEGSSELMYQINRPRPSKLGIEGLRINRISRWSVIRVQRVTTSFALMGGEPGPQTFQELDPLFFCKLDFDVNTSPHFSEGLPRDRLPELMTELLCLAKEICTNGDIP